MKRKISQKQSKLMDALNLIDEQAEQMGGDLAERKARQKAYELVADFILIKG